MRERSEPSLSGAAALSIGRKSRHIGPVLLKVLQSDAASLSPDAPRPLRPAPCLVLRSGRPASPFGHGLCPSPRRGPASRPAGEPAWPSPVTRMAVPPVVRVGEPDKRAGRPDSESGPGSCPVGFESAARGCRGPAREAPSAGQEPPSRLRRDRAPRRRQGPPLRRGRGGGGPPAGGGHGFDGPPAGRKEGRKEAARLGPTRACAPRARFETDRPRCCKGQEGFSCAPVARWRQGSLSGSPSSWPAAGRSHRPTQHGPSHSLAAREDRRPPRPGEMPSKSGPCGRRQT